MLSPAEMQWGGAAKQSGDVPGPRSGHTLTAVGKGVIYMIGGLTKEKPAGPTNDVYKLQLEKNTNTWTKIQPGKMQPLPRWHHTATFDGLESIWVFGGYTASFAGSFGKKKALRRYHDDVWVFHIPTETWSQPSPAICSAEDGMLIFFFVAIPFFLLLFYFCFLLIFGSWFQASLSYMRLHAVSIMRRCCDFPQASGCATGRGARQREVSTARLSSFRSGRSSSKSKSWA